MTRLHLLYAAILSACAFVPGAAAAQPATTPTQAHKLEFDAVAIHRSPDNLRSKGLELFSDQNYAPLPPGGHFSLNVPLNLLITFAYTVHEPQVAREVAITLPKWTQTAWYSVEARAEGNPTRDEVRQMMRSMLEERFHLAAHFEKRAAEQFALEVDKPGPGLKPHPEGAPCTLPPSLTDPKKYPHAYPPYDGFAPRCGVFNRELSHSSERRLEMLNVTMDQIAGALTQMTMFGLGGSQLAVVDRTGLTGHYDAVLDIAPPLPPNAEAADDTVGAPQLTTGLQKELGLKLVKQPVQMDFLVIDHIEPLTEN